MHSKASETGLSEFHKMGCTFMQNTYSHQEPVKTAYRDYKGLGQTNQDLKILLTPYLMQIVSMINKSLHYRKF